MTRASDDAERSDEEERRAVTEDAAQRGRHELPPHQPRPKLRRGRKVFGVLAVLLCLLSGAAIVTQVRQN
ncbi:MAG: DUF881 domain-containing protein, partial [Mycobacterium sp.]